MMGHVGNLEKRINPAIGADDALIVPLDFPDLRGDTNLSNILKNDKEKFLAWVDYYSSSKLRVNLDSIDHWIHMPKPGSFYNLDNYVGSNENNITQSGNTKIAQTYIDEITKEVDLTKYRSILILYPSNHDSLKLDLVPRMVEFKIKEGTRRMSLFADPAGYDSAVATPVWAFWLHELGHDWGLYGHAPGNGWSVGLMANQGGMSLSLNAWERFLLNWMPDDLVFCETKKNLVPATIQLSPLERADQQTKMMAVALDDHRLLVVEAHGIGDWTDIRPEQKQVLGYRFDTSGYYSVLAYIVNTQFTAPIAPIVNADGSALQVDGGINPNLPRYSYFIPVDGGVGSSDYHLYTVNSSTIDYSSYFAVKGDTFTVEGVHVKVVDDGDYVTLSIS